MQKSSKAIKSAKDTYSGFPVQRYSILFNEGVTRAKIKLKYSPPQRLLLPFMLCILEINVFQYESGKLDF